MISAKKRKGERNLLLPSGQLYKDMDFSWICRRLQIPSSGYVAKQKKSPLIYIFSFFLFIFFAAIGRSSDTASSSAPPSPPASSSSSPAGRGTTTAAKASKKRSSRHRRSISPTPRKAQSLKSRWEVKCILVLSRKTLNQKNSFPCIFQKRGGTLFENATP